MKISFQAIKQIYQQAGIEDFLPGASELAERIGSQLGEIEQVMDLGKKYEGIVVAKVVECIDHPDADKLKLCKVDDGGKVKDVERGDDGHVQVVCGAPNVAEGMLAVWLPPGVTIPDTADKDPLVLEARKIRGQTSNGMLASPSELGISDDHDGILAIDKETKPGEPFAQLYKLDDFIFEIENKMFTHRPDCFGLLGIAREIAGIYGKAFTSPDWYTPNPELPEAEENGLKLEVKNEIPQIVPRFCMLSLSDVKVSPSPIWMQVALSKFGIKSINNVVDMTNFYMMLSGQPLHAYDYDKVAKLSGKGAEIKVRKAKSGEKLMLLNGKQATMNGNEIMIATDEQPIGIAGVIGGADTEVDSSTTNIILECANFDSYSIRRTSMAHGIFTDAVTRFTKGQSPHQNLAVLAKITNDIVKFTGAKPGTLFDIKDKLAANKPVKVSASFINERLGLKLTDEKISGLLENVEFKVDKSGQDLQVTAPFWRTDIEIPEDIVEEVGRLYGYDHLPLQLPKKPMSASVVSDELLIKQKVRERLSALGANEVLNYSFVRSELLEAAGQDTSKSFKVKNALSPELEYYRQSLTPSLLEKIHPNIKSGFDSFALFELGKVHIKGEETEGLPKEFERAALVIASKNKSSRPAFYTAKKYLVELLSELAVAEDEVSFEINGEEKDPAAAYYLPNRMATVKVRGEIIGRIGEYKQRTASSLKLPEYCAGFEIGLKPLLGLARQNTYRPLSRYPSTEQDICLRTKASLSYADIRNALTEELEKNSPDDVTVNTSCIDIFSNEPMTKQTTFRVTASSFERTLTSEIMNLLFEKSAPGLKNSIDADIV